MATTSDPSIHWSASTSTSTLEQSLAQRKTLTMSRFVAAGSSSTYTPPTTTTPAADEWSLAQKELEASRQRKEEQSRSQQQSGSSLYETLQANKGLLPSAFSHSITFLRRQDMMYEAQS